MMRAAPPFLSTSADGAADTQTTRRGRLAGAVGRLRHAVPVWLWMSFSVASRGDLLRAASGAALHGAGQAGLAVAVAALGAGLGAAAPVRTAGDGVMDGRSMLGAVTGGAPVLTLVVLALVASAVEAAGAALAGAGEGRIAFGAGAYLRASFLRGWLARHRLRGARHRDHGGKVGDVGEPEALDALAARVRDVERGVLVGVLGGARALARIAPLGVLLVHLGRRALAPAALGLVALVLGLAAARRALRRRHARAEAARLELVRVADEAVRHAELWASYGAEARVLASVARTGATSAARGAEVHAAGQALGASSQLLGALALAAVLVVRELTGRPADVTPILVLAAVSFLAYRPVRELVEAASARAAADAAWPGLAPFVALGLCPPADPLDPRPPARGSEVPAPLRLVAFRSRHGRHPVLDAEVRPGALAALVGPNGVGKTSLLRALAGLDDGASGTVTWGDRALDGASAGPTARPFALVPAEPPLLAGTLRENVLVGPAADEALAREVLALADLDGALDELVGPGGRALSAGERRIVGLARAVATRSPCLLVDEPTAHLDDERARAVLEALRALRGVRSVLVATHDARVRAAADVTLTLADPRVG